jgi:activin receptor type-1
MCYKSSVRDSEGNERQTRGCTTKFDHLPLYCNQRDIQRGPKKREVSGLGTYNIECCEGDYCNSGPFPLLPPLPPIMDEIKETTEDVVLKYCLAIFGPVVIIGLLTVVIVVIMRRNHKKRLMEARNSQDPDIYYASDDLLKRSHACGDSTLRVSK